MIRMRPVFCYPGLECPRSLPPAEYGNSPQSSGDRNADSGGGSGPKRGTLDGCNSGSPSNTGSGKSFKQVLAERNKQAQRRFRQRQKVQQPAKL